MSQVPENEVPRTRDQVLRLANAEAQSLGHNFIGTEHVLCALCCVPEITVLEPLLVKQVGLDVVRSQVLQLTGFGPPRNMLILSRPFTPRLNRILSMCEGEMLCREHLTQAQAMLVAIIDEGHGVAARVLKTLGVDLSLLREGLVRKNA
jgi:ATP-dependent Clp protease ATP-binding subunit ClpC